MGQAGLPPLLGEIRVQTRKAAVNPFMVRARPVCDQQKNNRPSKKGLQGGSSSPLIKRVTCSVSLLIFYAPGKPLREAQAFIKQRHLNTVPSGPLALESG